MTDKEILQALDRLDAELPFDEVYVWAENSWQEIDVHELLSEIRERIKWHYPSKGELPDKDWSKHPNNVSKECFVLIKRGIGTIARWDNDYKTWFEKPYDFAVPKVIAWQYFIPPKEEA